MNRMDRILNETGPVSILLIRFILSRTLNATSRTTVRFPRKLGSFFPSFFRYGTAVVCSGESSAGQLGAIAAESRTAPGGSR
jgi:hypothetical protein